MHAAIGTTTFERQIMRLDGSTWTALDGAPTGGIRRLIVHDDGQGSSLFAAGLFQTVETSQGLLAARNIARFDGEEWHPVGDGLGDGSNADRIDDLAVFDDGHGRGAALFASGSFSKVGDGETTVNHVARWERCVLVRPRLCQHARDR